MEILKELEKNARKGFNWWVLHETKVAQEKYGFDMTLKKNSYSNTHNNEADAFKHAYMSWFLAYWGNDKISKELGDMHEDETPKAPSYERNMDLWNNAIGREIAYEMKRKLGDDYDLLGEEWAIQTAKRKIYEKMQQGELITDPFTDKRKFENMELERLKEEDRVYTNDEYKSFDEEMKEIYTKKYIDYIVDNDLEVPSIKNLDRRVQSGELIYVEEYTRSDGTKVSGYYRRKPYYINF